MGILLLLGGGNFACKEQEKPQHVFLIFVDDLRPELGCYGNAYISSPSLDALAQDALLFEAAYANIPVCGASRASLLSGMRPTRKRFAASDSRLEVDAPEALSLPAYLKAKGYKTLSMGKVFHHQDDSDTSWYQPPYRGPKLCSKDYVLQANIEESAHNPRQRASAFERIDTTDEAYLDGKLAHYALRQLEGMADSDTPVFMAVGFWKPHLPFVAPKSYWDMYDPQALPFPQNYFTPEGAPEASLHAYGELRSYTDIPNDKELPLDSALARQLIHGYYACVSYVDAQIGKFLQGLKDQGLYESSTIVVVGDHGWFLGEHTLWCKHANYRDALRTSLLIKFPENQFTGSTDLPVELVELYPSILDIVGIAPPPHLHASSFVPDLQPQQKSAEKELYCRFREGETILQGPFAYTEYVNEEGGVYGRMLYDHRTDPHENRNIIKEADTSLVATLSSKLRAYRNQYAN